MQTRENAKNSIMLEWFGPPLANICTHVICMKQNETHTYIQVWQVCMLSSCVCVCMYVKEQFDAAECLFLHCCYDTNCIDGSFGLKVDQGSTIWSKMLRAQGLAEQMTDSKLSHYTMCGFVCNRRTWFHTIISASQATLLNERCSENPATLAVTITMSWSEQYFTSDNFSKAGLQSLRSVVISCPFLVNCLPRQLIFLAPDPLRSMTPCPFLKDSTFTWTVSLNLMSQDKSQVSNRHVPTTNP